MFLRWCFRMNISIWANFLFPYTLFEQFQTLKAYQQGFEDIALLKCLQKHLMRIFWSDMRYWSLFCACCKAPQFHKPIFQNIQTINSLPYRFPFASQSRRRRACNPQLVAVWNRDIVAYWIKPQGDTYARLRVMPYAFGDSIQCASALIPYQACGLDKKITSELKSSDVIFFGDPSGNLNPRMRLCSSAPF